LPWPACWAIAGELGITKGAVAHFMEALVQLNLVERSADSSDRRIAYISLTKEGKAKTAKLEKSRNKIFKEQIKTLSDSELAQLIKINSKILKELK
jgi:DNA-binding MarR family transcriptional regulator